jgi:glycosyltransferase involved in cell wall biosynthesis
MKILMVISQFYPVIGGAEKQAQLLARTLLQKGIEVKILTGWWNRKTPRKEIIDGVMVIRNFCGWGMFGLKRNRTIRMVHGLIYMVSLAAYLILHRREYDIIHVHQALYPAFVSVLVGKQVLGKSVIVKTASSGMTSDIKQLERYPLGKIQVRFLIKKMGCLVANSKVGGDEFKELGFRFENCLSRMGLRFQKRKKSFPGK